VGRAGKNFDSCRIRPLPRPLCEGITNSFDRNGSFGLTTSITNLAGVQTVDTSARFSALNTIPTTSAATYGSCPSAPCPIVEPPPQPPFPVTPPAGATTPGGFAITWGLDDKLKTPYSHMVDFTVTRELPRNFVFEASYVGRFAHRLLQEEDLAEPVDLVDPKTGMDYFHAVQALAKLYNAGVPIQNITPANVGQKAYPILAGYFPGSRRTGREPDWGVQPRSSLPGHSPSHSEATQAMYDLFCYTPAMRPPLSSTPTYRPDQPGYLFPGVRHDQWQQQSFYILLAAVFVAVRLEEHGQQRVQRRPVQPAAPCRGSGVDINYTYSKSIDIGSNAERINEFEGSGFASQVINSWSPKQLRAVSDFDATHQINSNWVYELPVGHASIRRKHGPLGKRHSG